LMLVGLIFGILAHYSWGRSLLGMPHSRISAKVPAKNSIFKNV